MFRLSRLRAILGAIVLAGAVVVAGLVWLKDRLLTIDPGPGAPVGLVVRTETHLAALLQTLEPYVPTLHRDHSQDTFTVSTLLVPLDGSPPRLVPIASGLPSGSFPLARILGSDGRTLWFDVNGTGGVDLASGALVRGAPASPRALEGARPLPLAPRLEANLASGWFTSGSEWLGLLSASEVERSYGTRQWLRRITHAEDAKQPRRFYRGTVGESSATGSRRILSMQPLGEAQYLGAAFLRMNEQSEPLRLAEPDGALMIFTSDPGPRGTLVVARADTSGGIVWKADTPIDRFTLGQILPGGKSLAFVGSRPPVPGKVSEPLVVIVENATGAMVIHSLWR